MSQRADAATDEWAPDPCQLRAGETPDTDAHAARNLEMIRRGVEDGILDVEDLSPERQRELTGSA